MPTLAKKYILPSKVDAYIRALSRLYESKQELVCLNILLNSTVTVSEAWDSNNWNGGSIGHAVSLHISENIFFPLMGEKTNYQTKIREDLNSLHNIHNEYITEVYLELKLEELNSELSNTLKTDNPPLKTVVSEIEATENKNEALNLSRLWMNDCFRVFLSHKATYKVETAKLSDELKLFGISAFVAHVDIEPAQAWQDEIESALKSMQGFVALLTEDFKDSNWTDQEIGFAVARGTPIIAARLGLDPYGFIGKFQGLPCNWENLALEIAKFFIKQPKALDAYIHALDQCNSFESGNKLALLLPEIITLNGEQLDKLIVAHNENTQIRGSHGFEGSRNSGLGLMKHLERITGKSFKRGDYGMITKNF